MQVDSPPVENVPSAFRAHPFVISTMKDKFLAQAGSDLTQTYSDSAMAQDPTNPALVQAEIDAQIEFFKKIKFKYLEQEAKETFLKLILAEDPVQIDREDNNRLEEENKQSKAALRQAKSELDTLKNEVMRVAEDVATGHTQLSNDIQEAELLTREIAEMELELARLRTTVPVNERLTTDEANDLLDAQIVEIQTLSDEVQAQSTRVDETKRELAKLAKEVDRLGPERVKEELRVKNALLSQANESGDLKRIESICKWYNATLALHKSFLSIESIVPTSLHELRLTYHSAGTTSSTAKPFSLVMAFDDSPLGHSGGILVDATLTGSNLNITEAVGKAVTANDVPGLVADVLMRLRAMSSA